MFKLIKKSLGVSTTNNSSSVFSNLDFPTGGSSYVDRGSSVLERLNEDSNSLWTRSSSSPQQFPKPQKMMSGSKRNRGTHEDENDDGDKENKHINQQHKQQQPQQQQSLKKAKHDVRFESSRPSAAKVEHHHRPSTSLSSSSGASSRDESKEVEVEDVDEEEEKKEEEEEKRSARRDRNSATATHMDGDGEEEGEAVLAEERRQMHAFLVSNVRHNHLETVQKCIAGKTHKMREADEKGNTLLHVSAQNNLKKMASLLLKTGIPINQENQKVRF